MKNKYVVMFVGLLVIALLQGCGWRLRGASLLPETVRFAMVSGVAEFSKVGLAIKQLITSSGAMLVTEPDTDTIHFVVLENRFTRRVLSVDSSGTANEYGLSYDFRMRVLDGKGKLLVPSRAINLNRVYTYNKNNAIAMSDEEANIKSQMISFAVQQAMRRIGVKLRGIELSNSDSGKMMNSNKNAPAKVLQSKDSNKAIDSQ